MKPKLLTARAIISTVASLAQAADLAKALEAEYFDAGSYTDDELNKVGVTTDTLAGCITLLQQVENLMAGAPTVPAVYRSTLNKVRRVAQE